MDHLGFEPGISGLSLDYKSSAFTIRPCHLQMKDGKFAARVINDKAMSMLSEFPL